jgi:hypothetical protein
MIATFATRMARLVFEFDGTEIHWRAATGVSDDPAVRAAYEARFPMVPTRVGTLADQSWTGGSSASMHSIRQQRLKFGRVLDA